MDPYVGQIEAFAFNFTPRDWAPCNGMLMSIDDNGALYSLIGTVYGGDGINNFAVPDLRGRALVHLGVAEEGGATSFQIGVAYGNETAKLTGVPSHSHTFMASSGTSFTSNPNGASLAAATLYSKAKLLNLTQLNEVTISPDVEGAGAPFGILQPFIAINWCISLYGSYPEH